jgi:hypothetical protein
MFLQVFSHDEQDDKDGARQSAGKQASFMPSRVEWKLSVARKRYDKPKRSSQAERLGRDLDRFVIWLRRINRLA